MSDPAADWGDMVMPGVYMIKRHNQSAATAVANANAELGINYEQLYLEAEEIQKHIDKLLQSNDEIMDYLKKVDEGSDDAHDDMNENADWDDDVQGMHDMRGMSDLQSGGSHPVQPEVSDTDVEIFRDALLENEGVIASKKRRLEDILKILAANKCGCQFHKSTETHVPLTTDATEPPLAVPADRFSL